MSHRLAASAAALVAAALLAGCATATSAPPPPDGIGTPALDASVALSVLACEPLAECVAAGTNPTSTSGDATIEVSPGGAHRWRTARVPALPGVSLSAAACWSSGCLLGGSGPDGTVVVLVNPTTMAAARLASRPAGSGIAALSCTGPGRCLALVTGTVSTIVFSTSDSGQSWRQLSSLPSALQSGTSMSCASAARCVAGGTGPKGAQLARTADGGRHWTYSSHPGGLQVITSVACNGTTCLAAARRADGSAVLLHSSNAARRFTSLATKVAVPVAVTCINAARCLVGGAGASGGAISEFTFALATPPVTPGTSPGTTTSTTAPVPASAVEQVLTLQYVPDPVIGLACATPSRCAGVTQASTVSLVP